MVSKDGRELVAIPPGLLEGDADLHLPYLVLGENVIDRLYDQNTGYWQADLQGLDALSRADHGALLVDYLDVSESRSLEGVERILADGRYELAASALEWTPSADARPLARRAARVRQADGEVPVVQSARVHRVLVAPSARQWRAARDRALT